MSIGFARVTVFCRNLEASLAFYRDLLGLVVVEAKEIEGAGAGALLQLPPCRMKIALLAPTSDAPSMLGLFEIDGVELERMMPPAARPATGQTALVLSTNEFDHTHSKLAAAGVKFLTPPVRYPKHEASERSPAGIYREMIAYDPDGVLVSVMQIEPLPRKD